MGHLRRAANGGEQLPAPSRRLPRARVVASLDDALAMSDVSPEDAVAVMDVIEAAIASAETGRVIAVGPTGPVALG